MGLWTLLGWPVTAALLQPGGLLKGKTVAVVGGGVGGLVSAGLLAQQGAQVTVFERRGVLGGRLGENWLGTASEWRFDTGPSLLLMPDVYRDTLKLLGDPEPLDMAPVAKPFYHAFFGGDDAGTPPIVLDPVRCRNDFEEALERLEGRPGDSMQRFDRYMASCRACLDGGWPLAIEERWDWTTLWKVLPGFIQSALTDFPANLPVGQSHMAQLQRYFPHSERVRALLSFQDLYVGLSPYEAPAVFSLLQAMELDATSGQYGVRYPIGGFGQVLSRLQSRCDSLGVAVRCGVSVDQIEISDASTDGGRASIATGVQIRTEADGTVERFAADIVLCNADVPVAEAQLLPAALSRTAALKGAASSSSVVSLSFALDRQFDAALAHHTIVFADDLGPKPWESLFGATRWSSFLPVDDRPMRDWCPGHFYVHCPTRTDPSAAPPGCDAITVLLPTPPLPDDAPEETIEALSREWTSIGRRAVIERLGRLPGTRSADRTAPRLASPRLASPRLASPRLVPSHRSATRRPHVPRLPVAHTCLGYPSPTCASATRRPHFTRLPRPSFASPPTPTPCLASHAHPLPRLQACRAGKRASATR